ncbi:hypothetical protein [Colwellia sp. PAMC 21821]|uniref:hypothetical protein n=1 Tax=Colwellia sp. PAMC 21821 TaxID=1816219 RepID=UPI0009BDA79E|nr:hypothetical protein [Colwellia sp. PAMC 21821]ARD45444.1 hypothetical protein A3Q33_14795 [Colwellia sp. PAMC 21821]
MESIYEKYFFQFWYCLGCVSAFTILPLQEFSERSGDVITFLYLLAVAGPLALMAYVVYVFSSFAIHLVFSGLKERKWEPIFGALWVLICIGAFLIG